jgi:hypothetical protein
MAQMRIAEFGMMNAELIAQRNVKKNESITVHILRAFTPHSAFRIGKGVDTPFG